MAEYGAILILFAGSAAVAAGMILVTGVLAPKKRSPTKDLAFECGKNPFMLPNGHFSVKFYLLAMLFILFDVELVYLVPWAVLFRDLRWFGLGEMGVFLLFLLAGFGYAWKKGALEWQ